MPLRRLSQSAKALAKRVAGMLKATFAGWSNDRAARMAAALAFYTLLSLAPLIVISVSIAGIVFGQQAARGQIAQQLATIVGPSAAETMQSIMANARNPGSGIIGSILGIVVLLFAASGVLGELQAAMNDIWQVAPRPGRGLTGAITDRFFSVSLALGVAFLLLVSLMVSAGLAGLGKWITHFMPGLWILHVVNAVAGLGVTALLFALMFKYISRAKVGWGPAWMGAGVTAVLFNIGKLLLAFYVAHSSISSSYGAATSLVVTIVWVYYSAQIWFFGAEFTEVYARSSGQRIRPAANAVPAAEAAKPEPGRIPPRAA